MNAKTDVEGSSGLDTAKLLAAIAMIWWRGSRAFTTLPSSSRVWVAPARPAGGGRVSAFVALQTTAGRGFWRFASDARTEVRKVVWPTRQETLQTVTDHLCCVLIMALVPLGIDSLLLSRWCVT